MKYLLFSQQCTFSSPSQHSLRILSSSLPFARNLPSTCHPNSCTVLWQQLICWLVLLLSLSMLPIGCPRFRNTGAFVDTHLTQPTSQTIYCFSIFADDDGHKRGQTSRPVVGTKIQANCNFEAHVYYCNYLLGFYPCRLFK